MTRPPLPRTPRKLDPIPGQRALDAQTMAMIVALASETTILRARLDACERLLVQAGVLAADAIDRFEPDAAAQAARDALRAHGLKKIFRPLQEMAEADLARAGETAAKEAVQ